MKNPLLMNYITILTICFSIIIFGEAKAQSNIVSNQYSVTTSDAKGCTATADAGLDFSVCSGGIAGLDGSYSGAATSAEWKGGLGSFDPSRFDTQADYYPDTSEFGTTVTLWLVTDDPIGTCMADSDAVDMTIILSPALHPIAPITFCSPDTSFDLSTITVLDSNNITGFLSFFNNMVPPMPLPGPIVAPPVGVPTVYNVFKVTFTTPSCFSIQPVTVTQNETITSASKIDESCTGFCNGQATATATGGTAPYTYIWSNGNTSSTAASLCPGNYTVTSTDLNGCTSSAFVSVNGPATNNLPLANFTFIDNGGGQFTFTNNSINATNYVWTFGDATTDTVSNPVHTYSVNGTYSVMLTASGPCGQHDTTFIVSVITGINETFSDFNIVISPNPASTEITIDFTNANFTIDLIQLSDLLGRIIFIEKVNPHQQKLIIALDELENGTYFVHFRNANKKLVHKILIRK